MAKDEKVAAELEETDLDEVVGGGGGGGGDVDPNWYKAYLWCSTFQDLYNGRAKDCYHGWIEDRCNDCPWSEP